jgi:hypothetical protein
MEMQAGPKPQVLIPQCTSSMKKVEGDIGSTTLEDEVHKEVKIPQVHKEPKMASTQRTTSIREQMELVLQNPQQCAELLQLCLARIDILTFLSLVLRLRFVTRPSIGEEEVEIPSQHSMTSGLPLQV